ncbi:MAG: pilus assembly protein TadG-related protein [Microbacteriaceae bacterium]|nr:pilus assembly protein TadG-related protein [Microbacteriaceae bacterium]
MSVPVGVGMCAALLIGGTAVLAVSGAVQAQAALQAAADSAVLAAADSLAGFIPENEPCAVANAVAASNGAEIQACELDEEALEAVVTVKKQHRFGILTAKARAGVP